MEYLNIWGKAVRGKITPKLSFEECAGITHMNTKTRNYKAQYLKQVKNFKDL